MKITDLIPAQVQDFINKVLDGAASLLQGETVLVIGNGAAVVIYLAAKALGAIPDVSFGEAVAQGMAAVVTLNTVLVTIRHYVYSPKTVASIVLTPPTAEGPVRAAVEAGAGDAIQNELDRG